LAAFGAVPASPSHAAAAPEGHFPWEWLIVVPALAAVALLWRLGGERRPTGGARRRKARGRAQPLAEAAFPPTETATQADTQVDTQLDPRTVEPHRRIGPYLIERDIGRGAMGMVLLGRDLRSGESVALKTMALGREFHGSALLEARDRFFREAEMAGRLQHPDIVSVREAGEEGGTAYIAMELLTGRDLSEHAQPSRLLPVPQVLQIAARVARALAYAHRQGVTHRDIKPANIMIEPRSGMVKVTDFGIARIMDSSQTRTGLVLGTPSFMSPEQMAGSRVDGRSDLYSLGVTLFQLLTGQLPHRADSMAQLIRSIGNDTAPDVRELRPELPEALANVVALALEKRMEVRYADGDALAADLEAVGALLGPAPEAWADAPIATDAPRSGAAEPPEAAEAGHNL
jgi:serine/threonine-protein kinase